MTLTTWVRRGFFFFLFFFPLCILQKQLMEQMEWRNSNDLTVLYSWKFCCCSVAQSCPTSCDPVDCSMPGFPVLHYLPEFAQTHVHWVSDAIQPSHLLSSPSPSSFNLSQHQGLFKWVSSSSHQVAKVLGLKHQSFQWIFRVDFL